MNTEATDAAFLERGIQVRGGGLIRMERLATVGKFDKDAAGSGAQGDADGSGHAVAATVTDGVGKQLLEDEIQVELDVLGKRVFTAKPSDLSGQRHELAHFAVE
ncbi:MAG TPA: hypothetical protein VMJ34_14030 [Bryobacteraceae bacterium]|nr:hypothetical protein [Bryobacteraceae bacterium]